MNRQQQRVCGERGSRHHKYSCRDEGKK